MIKKNTKNDERECNQSLIWDTKQKNSDTLLQYFILIGTDFKFINVKLIWWEILIK